MKKLWFYILAIGVFSLLIYLPSLRNGFIWDDEVIINHQIQTLRDVKSFLFPPRTQESTPAYYRPFVGLTLVLDHTLYYRNPRGYHLTNILINTLNCLLVFLFGLLFFQATRVRHYRLAAFLGALLFSVHPLHVESVSWIAGRTDLLATLFSLLAVISFMLFRRERNYAVLFTSLIFYFFAMLSKENALPLLLLFPALDLMVFRLRIKQTLGPFLAFLGVACIYICLRHSAGCIVSPPKGNYEPINYLTLWYAFGFYLRKLIYPLPLSLFIDHVPKNPVTAFAPVLFILVFVLSLLRKKQAAFLLLWLLLTLAPSLLIAINNIASAPLAERYLYLPSVAFSLLLPYLLYRIGQPLKREAALMHLILPLVFWFAVETVARQEVWRDDLSLWADTVKKAPRAGLPHNELGTALRERGRLDEAEREFLLALSSETEYNTAGRAYAATNLALLYMDRKDYSMAEKYFKEALALYPDYPIALYDLGLLYLLRAKEEAEGGKVNRALLVKAGKTLKKAVKVDPNFIRAHLLLGEAYYLYGKPEKAKEHLNKVIELDPRSEEARSAIELLSKISINETHSKSGNENMD